MAVATYATWPEFTEMWESDDFFGVPGVFTAPWWPVKLVILLSVALCALLFLTKLTSPKVQASKSANDEINVDKHTNVS